MRFFAFSILVFLWSCSPPATETSSSTPFNGDLTLTKDSVPLYVFPDFDADILLTLNKGDQIKLLDSVSAFLTPLKTENNFLTEPFWLVEASNDQIAWYFPSATDFASIDTNILIQKRLKSLFLKEDLEALQDYNSAFQQISTREDFLKVYRDGLRLRTKLVDQLERFTSSWRADRMPDLFWLKSCFAGYIPQIVAEGTAFYLFLDLGQWRSAAEQTPSAEDDSFVDLRIQAFPEDSIEYFFPAWTIQTWDYGGHSLLGRGIHSKLLGQIDQMLQDDHLFKEEIDRMKLDIQNDITDPNVSYWEDSLKVLKELNEIIDADFRSLNNNEKIALEAKKDMLLKASAYKITMGHKSGGQ